jgi:biopolymer transport protein ExbD
MAMQLGTGDAKGVTPTMNVTPLVDVVLVLLIIFMVVTPLLTKQFWVHTPKQEKEEVTQEQANQDPTPPLGPSPSTARPSTSRSCPSA